VSRLTAELMGENRRCGKRWSAVLSLVTDTLKTKYGTPLLQNYPDPVKEIFFILLSARTSENLYVRAMDALFAKYKNCQDLADASAANVMDCISLAGLGEKRSEQVIQIARRLIDDFGSDAGDKLREMTPVEVYGYLTSLPGVGPKSALCVMMWSLDIDVLPVDVNVQRIAARLGVIPCGLKHYQAQKKLPKYVPDGRSRELHSAFMVHGRLICTPRNPKCSKCEIRELCSTGRAKNKK
jgi:endonuclease III